MLGCIIFTFTLLLLSSNAHLKSIFKNTINNLITTIIIITKTLLISHKSQHKYKFFILYMYNVVMAKLLIFIWFIFYFFRHNNIGFYYWLFIGHNMKIFNSSSVLARIVISSKLLIIRDLREYTVQKYISYFVLAGVLLSDKMYKLYKHKGNFLLKLFEVPL